MNAARFGLDVLQPRKVERSLNDHLVLNVLSRISALAEVDVPQCQRLVVTLGRYVQVSSRTFSQFNAAFYCDLEELSAGMRLLCLMKGIDLVVELPRKEAISAELPSHAIFEAFSRWADAELFGMNGLQWTNLKAVVAWGGSVSGIRLSILGMPAGLECLATWQAKLRPV